MGDRERRTPPAQPVALELERADGRRRGGERIEGAEVVARESRLGDLAALDGAARLGLGLQYEDTPAVLGEQAGGHQRVVAGADGDRVKVGWHPSCLPARAPG